MLAALLAIGVHVEEVANTPLALAEALTSSLAYALRERTHVAPNVDTLDWPACGADDRCLPEIRARLDAGEIVLLRYFAGPTLIRVVAHRMRPGENVPRQAIEVDVPKDRARWRSAFTALAHALYPEDPPREDAKALVLPSPLPAAASRFGPAPYIAFGAAAAALAVGIVFGAKSANTRDEIRGAFHTEGELADLDARLNTQALTANVGFLLAALGAATGVTLLVFD